MDVMLERGVWLYGTNLPEARGELGVWHGGEIWVGGVGVDGYEGC